MREVPTNPSTFFSPLEKERGECRRERERVKRGDQDGDCNGDRKLLIHPSRDAGDCRRRNEDSSQDEGDGDHGAAHFFHGFLSCRFGVHPFVDVVFNSLNNDDGVVNHQADSEHKAEQ
jgi:hypothetical protein